MDSYIELRLQPIFDYFDSSKTTRRLSTTRKDELFADSLKKLQSAGLLDDAGKHVLPKASKMEQARHLIKHINLLYKQ